MGSQSGVTTGPPALPVRGAVRLVPAVGRDWAEAVWADATARNSED